KGICDSEYNQYPISNIHQLSKLLEEQPGLSGLNVTIPYKQSVIPFLNELDLTAETIGAVNTIKISRISGKIQLIGYNTDAIGFEKSLIPFLKSWHTQALILGTGGASKAVEYVLKKLGISYNLISRTPNSPNALGYHDLDKNIITSHTLIINTTPLGMYPNIDSCPDIPYDLLGNRHLLYDLVYNPSMTLFMKKGESQGSATTNGMAMLQYQALEAWEIWNA
ncbi:MAG: shikimate dehydrogenase, partial [Bacteroidales bacterium]|nr:shikimate dehydrogenase [Bacteroidales bacterium]